MTKNSAAIDTARVELLLTELRLPAIKQMWLKLAEQADKEGWPAARFLAALAELEIADRGRRRIERHLAEARLPVGKTLDAFDFAAVPMISKALVMALASGDGWIQQGSNILLFGPPGVTVEENRGFLGCTDEKKQYYDHLTAEAIHGAMNTASPSSTDHDSPAQSNDAEDNGQQGEGG